MMHQQMGYLVVVVFFKSFGDTVKVVYAVMEAKPSRTLFGMWYFILLPLQTKLL